ncbi:MAG TPA: Cys-tRNA(Pro) deacylase [Tetrasphaera sp.]|uniref:Cys-tRNA(Pro) deacylase n=1 Tax=Nostocoides sp. TaxID=1917966 RepID=UPI002BBA272E|nr:Cys-tRNA(Pro) deacylase [Tetrasphaera sp.]HNQ06376.1 Cys-tRNA(Pro) deacylase [Tetrasphaera sp.]
MPKPTPSNPTTQATMTLSRAGIAFTTHVYVHDPGTQSYGLEAAAALGLPPEAVFKTLLVDLDGARAKVGVGIVPVDKHLDLKAIAAALGAKKAAMSDPAVAERLTGYVVGGISPIGQKRALATVLDASAAAQPVIYVSGGRRGVDIGLAPADLLAVTGGRLGPIAR